MILPIFFISFQSPIMLFLSCITIHYYSSFSGFSSLQHIVFYSDRLGLFVMLLELFCKETGSSFFDNFFLKRQLFFLSLYNPQLLLHHLPMLSFNLYPEFTLQNQTARLRGRKPLCIVISDMHPILLLFCHWLCLHHSWRRVR